MRGIADGVLRRPCRRPRGERGSAIVEFIMLGLIMLIPLIYLVMTMARLQAGAYAASMAVRESGRAFVTASADDNAYARAQSAAGLSFADYDFTGSSRLTIECSASPCLTPGATVRSYATVAVPLPLVPGFLRDVVPLEITLSSQHLSTVDRFRGQQ